MRNLFTSTLFIFVLALTAHGQVGGSATTPTLKVSDGQKSFNGVNELRVPVGCVTFSGRTAIINCTAGTSSGTTSSQNGNLFYASPNGSYGLPSWRAIVEADLPSLSAAKIATGAVSNTEFNYLDGVTSGIQAQLDAKATTASVSAHIADTANPHAVTKTQVGLSSVTNDAQLKIASNLSDVASAATARTNLGLGTAATLNVPAAGNAGVGEVVKGSDTRLTDARTPTAHASSHSSGSTDPISHNNLSGLTTGDPHTQYLLADGTRSLTGALRTTHGRVQGVATGAGGVQFTNTAGGAVVDIWNNTSSDFAGFSLRRPGGALDTGDFQYYLLGPSYASSGLFQTSSVLMASRANFTNGMSLGTEAGGLDFFTGGLGTANRRLRIDATGAVEVVVSIKTGANGTARTLERLGTCTLVAGTCTVSDANVTASSKIFLAAQDNNTIGVPRVSSRTASTSFTITSSNAADSGVVAWQMIN